MDELSEELKKLKFLYSENENFMKILNNFQNDIRHETFSAYGIFEFDIKFMFAVTVTVLSQLIFLVQFQTSGTSDNSNATETQE